MFAIKSISRVCYVLLLAVSVLALIFSPLGVTPAHTAAFLIDMPGPPSSVKFGSSVTALPNGNFVVTDPSYNQGRGAAFLYSPDRILISLLTGDFYNTEVGSGGVTVLTNGNYLVRSPNWGTPPAFFRGAVTWCNQSTGCSGIVSAANSLVGSTANDEIGRDMWGGVTVLTNGNYLVRSPYWDNGSIVDAGAVTWGNGTSGTTGVVSITNSLVGGTANDEVGSDFNGGVITLTNGNYLICNSGWDNGSAADAGAVTWGNGLGGTVGVVSAANSLVGGYPNDQLGGTSWSRVTELTNGNYIVSNSEWDLDETHPDVGSVTWGSGATGVAGLVSPSNSLVGTSASAPVGNRYLDSYGVTVLSNGNYVVNSPYWSSDGTASHWGAATWGNGVAGVSGSISASNSLVGSHFGDYVGSETIALTNGNYVVSSPDANAVTWGDGTSGTTGVVSISNSLVGLPNAGAGSGGVIALSNGNYVVSSPSWYETPGPINIGAVTWGNGTTGITGPISISNSLVGVNTFDSVGDGGLIALTNGNYVVISSGVFGTAMGTVTWVDGSHVTTGVVSAANSLVGSTANDQVGSGLWSSGVIALSNGNYLVGSPSWDNGSITDAGAVTWGNGTSGIIGVVSAANSLVGSSASDQVGSIHWDGGVIMLTNSNYVVSIPQWDNGSLTDAGAVAWGNGASGTTGVVSDANSLVGSTLDDMVGSGSFYGAAGVTPLTNGNYLVNSPHWWSSATVAGAITWGNGSSGIAGAVSAANSLVNTSANDLVFGSSTLTVLSDGNASIHFPDWNNGSSDGAVSLIVGDGSTVGPVSTANSVLGAIVGYSMVSDYDAVNTRLIVGRPWENMVTILQPIVTPTVVSVTRLDPTPTGASNVNYLVTFNQNVAGVDTSDFSLTTGGVLGATVNGVSGSGSVYTVTVNTGSGSGSIRLDVLDDDSIVNVFANPLGGAGAGNGAFAFGETYTINKTWIFGDVPNTYWSHSYIERLYNAGITAGCSAIPLNYCPTNQVTRAQMAIFLLRGMHGSAYAPPAATGTIFTDVPLGTFGAAWIEQLAAEGITSGCGGGNYCPNQTVSRAQMAIFLVRAKHGVAFVPPTATGIFPDVPVGSFGANFIEQLVADGITSGCGGGNYCPNTMVKRDSMAVFLVKTFNLP